ncbi:MAG TPA: phospholipase D-like domain-containing protein, partial [Terriglobales bacterium]
ISPLHVNGGSREIQDRQLASLTALSSTGVDVHVNDPEKAQLPYMHARAAVIDSQFAYLGSISFSPDSATLNREMGLIFRDQVPVQQLQAQFESDYQFRTRKF